MSPSGDANHSPGEPVGAIVVAAGESRRMRGVDKVFVRVGGQSLIAYTLAPFQASPLVAEVVLVLAATSVGRGRRLVARLGFTKVRAVCAGGPRRQDSVRLGLEALGPCPWVLVHDGARPLVTADCIARGLMAARETGAAVAAVPVKDTIKVVSIGDMVLSTPPRETLWTVQTPQVFRRHLLEEAHRRISEDVTDDAAMVERLGHQVRVFTGEYANIKVTTPEDLVVVKALLRQRRHKEGDLCV